MDRKYKYCIEYKTILNPDKSLQDLDNVRTRTRYCETFEEAKGWAMSVENTAGEWDPIIFCLDEE